MVREISWVRAARKDFGRFPEAVQRQMARVLRQAALRETADVAKPMQGLGAGVFEIALRYRRPTAWCMRSGLGEDVWVVHAFQKKSKTGIRTPKHEVDLTRQRLKRLKEELS